MKIHNPITTWNRTRLIPFKVSFQKIVNWFQTFEEQIEKYSNDADFSDKIPDLLEGVDGIYYIFIKIEK